MASITVSVKSGKVKAGLSNLGQSIPRVTNADIESVLKSARDELSKPGKPITYPVHWDSERQRRAYFATDGFGHGIPYQRSGAYNRNFKIEKTGSGVMRSYRLINDASYARYVGGTGAGVGQSRIHQGRWSLIAKVVQRYASNLVKNINQSIRDAIRAEGMGM